MISGLFALLDDIAAVAKATAASLDDVAVQALQAGKKTAGIVIDDTAVTPRYVVGFAAERELPIIARIAWGSIKNKLIYLLPVGMLLTTFAPWAITPLLMAGGLYLCFEGYEKVHQLLHPELAGIQPASAAWNPAAAHASLPAKQVVTEDQKVASAIRTDFILSSEIMAITLAAIEAPGFWSRAATLAAVAVLVTVGVYGVVALIVKADDFGLHLAQKGRTAWGRSFGNRLVHVMPGLLQLLSRIGTAAMLWVGGGIVVHGLETYGLGAFAEGLHGLGKAVGGIFGPLSGFIAWLIEAGFAGLIGLALGWLVARAAERLGSAGP